MNWEQIGAKWNHLTGSARERWSKLSENDCVSIGGSKHQLVRRIQERYGVTKAEAEKQADEWTLVLDQYERDRHAATRL